MNAAAHARLMERIRNATPEDHIASLVRAGILTKSGKFAPPYEEFEVLRQGKRTKAVARWIESAVRHNHGLTPLLGDGQSGRMGLFPFLGPAQLRLGAPIGRRTTEGLSIGG